MFTIENQQLAVTIDSKGAELKTIFHKQHQLQYMWEGDPQFWAKTSPVLFPIVGQLKNNTYQYKNGSYSLPRHGFAREQDFEVVEQQDDAISFLLLSNEKTATVYPFSFRFFIIYKLQDDSLSVTYKVENSGEDDMLFSVGGHPAFKLPLVGGTTYDDYKLIFEREETAGRWPVTNEGTIGAEPEPLLQETNELPLTKDLFFKDAVVLKHLQSQAVQLVSDKTERGLAFSFPGFPYLGLWAAPGADFLCIEPWCGIADSVNSDGLLENKEGINKLPPGETFLVTWSVRFF